MSRKPCRYNCGKTIEWNDDSSRFEEVDTGQFHSYRRCKELLNEQNKEIPFDR